MTADVLIMAAPGGHDGGEQRSEHEPGDAGRQDVADKVGEGQVGLHVGWIAMDARPMAAVVAMKKIQCTPKMSRPFLLSLADLVEA